MPDVLGETVPDVGAKVWESAKAMGFAVEALEFEHGCVCRRTERAVSSKEMPLVLLIWAQLRQGNEGKLLSASKEVVMIEVFGVVKSPDSLAGVGF